MQSGLLLEHTFRLFKQVLGWTAPKIRAPQAADRWTRLIIAVHAPLRLARPLAEDLRHPWERSASPGRLTLPGSAGGLETSAGNTRAQGLVHASEIAGPSHTGQPAGPAVA